MRGWTQLLISIIIEELLEILAGKLFSVLLEEFSLEEENIQQLIVQCLAREQHNSVLRVQSCSERK